MSFRRAACSTRVRVVTAAVVCLLVTVPLAGCSSWLYSDAVDLCKEHVTGGFFNPDTVQFSDVDVSSDGTNVEVSGRVSARGLDGSPVSGPWSCSAVKSSGGYWTADIDIDPNLA